MAISFQSQGVFFDLSQKRLIRTWLLAIIKREKKTAGQINFVFTSDEELLKINIQYLNHSTYTDIITFDSSHDKIIEGDIMISTERVKENAVKFGVDFETELHRVMAHGVMHLCGYKDKSAAQRKEMRRKEEMALEKLKVIQSTLK